MENNITEIDYLALAKFKHGDKVFRVRPDKNIEIKIIDRRNIIIKDGINFEQTVQVRYQFKYDAQSIKHPVGEEEIFGTLEEAYAYINSTLVEIIGE